MKRGQLRDSAVQLILDLFGPPGESRHILLPDVLLDPVSRLCPVPGIADMLNPHLPAGFIAGGRQAVHKARQQATQLLQVCFDAPEAPALFVQRKR